MPRWLIPLLLLLGVCCAAWALLRPGDSTPAAHHESVARASVADEPAPPLLRGRTATDDAASAAARVHGNAAVTVPAEDDAQPALDPRESAGGWAPVGVLAGMWNAGPSPDALDAGTVHARPRPTLRRGDLLGQVGPYGIRSRPVDDDYDWLGVARIEDETVAPATEDEVLVTAVTGRVVDEGAVPVTGAEVILYSSFYLRHAYYDHRVSEIGRTFTDGSGTFDLRPLGIDTVHFGADGDVLITIRHPTRADIVAQRLPNLRPLEENDLGAYVLPITSVSVRGVILDLQGQPVAGAAVRVSGAMNPVEYDKTERMVVLKDCPTALTDENGAYILTDFAPGRHEISIHVNLDCVLHVPRDWRGEVTWSPRVRAGGSVRGRVVDASGRPVAAAVVSGGGNWTPSLPDGTFWLDNIHAGPFTLEVAHHAWNTVRVPDIRAGQEDLEVVMEAPLARITLVVEDTAGQPVPLVAVDWSWPPGRGAGPFVPDSRYWHDANGRFELIVPERVSGATVSQEDGAFASVPAEALDAGAEVRVVLTTP